MKSWAISRRVVYIINIFCFFLILFSILGCGGDEEEPDSSQEIVGTWELVSIDGKTPKAYFQSNLGNEENELRSVTGKLVFASDGSLFSEASTVLAIRRNSTAVFPDFDFSFDFTALYHITLTTNGSYVISDAVIELISGDRAKFDVDVSIEMGGIWKQGLKEWAEENAQEWEEELIQDFGLDIDTYTFDLEGDHLTLTNGEKEVYRKR